MSLANKTLHRLNWGNGHEIAFHTHWLVGIMPIRQHYSAIYETISSVVLEDLSLARILILNKLSCASAPQFFLPNEFPQQL